MKHLFLDESGSHNLRVVDPDYPVFVLGGAIIGSNEDLAVISAAVRSFKVRVFGERSVILHTSDITRARNGFEELRDTDVRRRFYAELSRLVADLDFKVVACAIRKAAHIARYGALAVDPYMLSLGYWWSASASRLAARRSAASSPWSVEDGSSTKHWLWRGTP